MSTQVSIQSESMVDPRGEFRRKPVSLASRPASLKGKTVLLFDNSQLTSQSQAYGPIFRWFSEYLESKHGVTCVYRKLNLLKENKQGLAKEADEVAKSGADAVVVALCNAGITQPTSLFMAEIEARGLPSVQLVTEMGISLAGVTASNYAPGLPIVLAQPATGDQEVFGKEQTLAIAPEIVAGLTDAPAKLLARFRERFASVDLDIAQNGKIQLPPATASATEVQGKTTIRMDPSDAALYEALSDAGLSDGFPVIAPTEKRVESMLAFTDLDPELSLVDELPPSGSSITVRSLAANAVMSGCRPEYFPILVATFQAIADPVYRVFQGAITSHPAGNAVVISGPLAEELGIQSGPGCLGPGYRANATIGRAVNLTIMNVARAIPGKTDLGLLGSPAEYSYCFAESDKNNPWDPLHTDLYGPEVTSVTVHKCEGPHNVHDPRMGPEELLRNVAATAATAGGNNVSHPGHLLVILNPNQARMIAMAGWSKRDVKEFLFETARNPVDLVRREPRATFPPYYLKLSQVPVMRSPEDAILVVAGGSGGVTGGGFAMVGIPWGLAKAASRPVTLKDGSPLLTLKGRLG